ncbi:MAG TPA: YlxR family protein [Pseudonocardia sp.]|nr:YlxR family protein [Pseudonocardia sp.]
MNGPPDASPTRAGRGRGGAALHSQPALSSGPAPARPAPVRDHRSAAGPVRTCVGCRSRVEADGLLRVVAEHGELVPDPRRRRTGRGAWLHPVSECLDRAERRSAFPRALRVPGPLDTAPVRNHIRIVSGAREAPGPDRTGSKVDPS